MYRTINRSMCVLAAAVLGLALLLGVLVGGGAFSSRLKEEIRGEALLTAELIDRTGDPEIALEALNRASKGRRLTVIEKDGTVIFDNQADPETMGNHANRPEVRQAMETGTGEATRRSAVLNTVIYYYALRLKDGTVCRVAVDQYSIFQVAGTLAALLAGACLVLYFLAAVLAKSLTKRIIRPLEELSEPYEESAAVYPEIRPFLHKIAAQNREIKRQMERVRGQQIRLQLISERMNEGLAVLDGKGLLLSANKSGLDWLGMKAEDVGVATIEEGCPVKEVRQGVFRAGMGESFHKTFQKGERICRVFCSPVLEEQKVTGIVILLMDCSEQERNEQMRREFSANVSHELKTPLTSILGYAQLIGCGLAKGEDVVSFAQKIERESNRLIALINDIMALSRLEEQPVSEAPSQVSVKALAERVRERLKSKAEKKQVSVTVEGQDFTVLGNPSQLEELIENLCDNAIKYNRPEGRVLISLEPGILKVSDTGIGISQEDCQRIFERFYRVDKSRSKQIEGTGLGLSIVKHIAQSQRAQVSVSSQPGKGSCFTVVFDQKGDESEQ